MPSVLQMNKTSSGQLFKIKLKVNYPRQQGNTVKVLCKRDLNKTWYTVTRNRKLFLAKPAGQIFELKKFSL